MTSPITNCFDSKAELIRLDAERVWLYQPETEWTYSHHQSITFFQGRFYAIWSNGRTHEDDVGQRVLMSTAADFHRWTEPAPLVDSLMGKRSELVFTAAGFHEHEGTLVAYAGQYEYDANHLVDGRRKPKDSFHTDTTLRALTTRDGKTWSDLLDLKVPIVPNHGPQAIASGRLIISGNISFPYTDSPDGLRGWRMTGIYLPSMAEPIVDDSESFWKIKEAMGWPVGLCEGSFFQTDDGVLHMLLRSNTERLWLTESRDDGTTWSAPAPLDFSDNATKFHFGRLPDGRFYYVGCPDPEPRWARARLVLSLSTDGVRFDDHRLLADDHYEMKQPGHAKGGQFGYPHTLIHEGHLYVICSRRKEGVEAMRVPLGSL